MKTPFLVILFLIFSFKSFAQVEVSIGYHVGFNTYIESKQDNLSTEFNLGWDFDKNIPG